MKIRKIIQDSMKNVKERETAVIAFLGDSVTQGCFELYNAKDGSCQPEFKNECGYQAKLKRLFDMAFPQASVSMVNAGISGDSAPNGAHRVKKDVIDFRPQLVVVCYGLNDSGKGLEAIGEYEAGLRSIFAQLKQADIDILFMTPNMKATYVSREINLAGCQSIAESNAANQTDGIMDCYIQRAIQVCNECEVPVCDCYKKWKRLYEMGADVTHLLSNKINHPNEKMHWLFAWSLFEMIIGL